MCSTRTCVPCACVSVHMASFRRRTSDIVSTSSGAGAILIRADAAYNVCVRVCVRACVRACVHATLVDGSTLRWSTVALRWSTVARYVGRR